MKTLLVLCVLVAAASCEFSEIVFHDNCIGIKHSRPGKQTSDGYLEPGSWEIYDICCDKPFDTNTHIEGFNKNLKRSEIQSCIDANFDRLTRGKNNCQKSASGVA